MKIFQRVEEIWSGQECVTEGQMDGRMDGRTDKWTDEGHFYNPHPLRGGGLKKSINLG